MNGIKYKILRYKLLCDMDLTNKAMGPVKINMGFEIFTASIRVSFCLKFKVSCSLFLSGALSFIFSKPLILISSSIKSTSWDGHVVVCDTILKQY